MYFYVLVQRYVSLLDSTFDIVGVFSEHELAADVVAKEIGSREFKRIDEDTWSENVDSDLTIMYEIIKYKMNTANGVIV